MVRALYTLTIVALIGGTGWAASGIGDRMHPDRHLGLLILTALQR
jgi:hypothetical protein